jgi:hypothetical protein
MYLRDFRPLSSSRPFVLGIKEHWSKWSGSKQHCCGFLGALSCLNEDKQENKHHMREEHQIQEKYHIEEEHHTIHTWNHHMDAHT